MIIKIIHFDNITRMNMQNTCKIVSFYTNHQVKPLTTKVTSFLSLKQSSRTKPLSPDKTLADP